MKQLIRSLIASKFDEIVEKSILHCYTRNVHSILFTDKIRMFYVAQGHTLWKNGGLSIDMSVAYHPHHCNLDIIVNSGVVVNRSIMDLTPLGNDYEGDPDATMNVFRYESGLSIGCPPLFDKVGTVGINYKEEVCLSSEEGKNHLYLSAQDIHTVMVKLNHTASWFVVEGHEDPEYSGLTYHPRTPTIEEGLYVKPTAQQVLSILMECGLV